MIKLKLGERAPDGSAVLAHVSGPSLNASESLAFYNYAQNESGNATNARGLHGLARVAGNITTLVPASEIYLYAKVDYSPTEQNPRPLPYVWEVGSNTELGREEYYIFEPSIDNLDPTTEEARQLLRKNLSIVDPEGRPAGLAFYPVITSFIENSGLRKYKVKLHVERDGGPTNFYRLRYNAVAQTGANIIYNNLEAINAEPEYHVTPYTNPNRTELSGGRIRLVTSGVDAIDALGLAAETTGLVVTITGTTLTISGPALPARNFQLQNPPNGSISLREVVTAINSSGLPVHAVMLSNIPAVRLAPVNNMPISRYGTVLKSDQMIGTYVPHAANIEVVRPSPHLSPMDGWYMKLRRGLFGKDFNTIKLDYTVPEQTHYGSMSPGMVYVPDELPLLVAPNQLMLRNPGFHPDSVELMIDGQLRNDAIVDYDIRAGVLYLNTRIIDTSVEVSYTHDEPMLVLKELNVNPTNAHNLDSECGFYAIYITPSRRELTVNGSPKVDSYTETVHIEYGTTLQALLDNIAGLKDSVGYPMYPVVLGVFQYNSELQPNELQILDVRTRGGGVAEPTDDAPESYFFTDHGHVDGEPLPASGPVVVEVPSGVLDELELSLENDPDIFVKGFNETGGETDDSIRQIAGKTLAAGTYTLVDKYDE